MLLERTHRRERRRHARHESLRRARARDHDSSGVLMTRHLLLCACLTVPASLVPFSLSAQKRAITFDDFIAMKAVSDPQLSPDGRWVAYAVATPALAGHRQHVYRVELAGGEAKDLTPLDRDAPAIATGGDGDVAVSPDGREIAVAMHGDSTVADNTNVDVYLMGPDGSGMHAVTADNKGADNTPRYSPDGQWLSWLSMERAGFEADRVRLMVRRRTVGPSDSRTVEATAGWTLSVSSYTWCPDSKCVYAVVEERGRDNVYRIEVPTFRRTLA